MMNYRCLFLPILIVFTSVFVRAQMYDTLDFKNMTWNTYEQPFAPAFTDSTIYLGDTIWDGKVYSIFGDFNIPGQALSPNRVYLRNDTINGVAWFRLDYNYSDQILLDMRLNVNDTLTISGNLMTVDSVFFMANRKYIRFDKEIYCEAEQTRKFTMIEGVGWNIGMSTYNFGGLSGEMKFLTCAHEFDSLIYLHSYHGYYDFWERPCVGITSIDEIDVNNSISISPNPVVSYLKLDGLDAKVDRLSIIAIDGRVVLDLKNYLPSIPIDCVNLPSGVYLIQVRSGSVVKTAKFCK